MRVVESVNTCPATGTTFLLGLKLRALPMEVSERYDGTLGITRCFGGSRGIRFIGCPNLRKSGCRRLTGGCLPLKAYNIVSLSVRNDERGTVGFVSDLGLTSGRIRITSVQAYILRPTDSARERLASRRLTTTNVAPNLVHFSMKLRGISSVVRSVRRTLTALGLSTGPCAI